MDADRILWRIADQLPWIFLMVPWTPLILVVSVATARLFTDASIAACLYDSIAFLTSWLSPGFKKELSAISSSPVDG
jgi:hypothetical protein